MKMHVLSGGRLRMKKGIFLPDSDRSETIVRDDTMSIFNLQPSIS